MKNTKSRQKLKEFFIQNKGAFTAAQVHQNLADFDLATLYRNLNLFVEQGILRELSLVKGESLYELNHDNHEHAVCNNCGAIRHIHIDKEKIIHLINLEDFEVEDVEIVVRGKCAK